MNSLVEPVESYLDGTVTVLRVQGDYREHPELVTDISEAELSLSSLFPALKDGALDLSLDLHPTIAHDQGGVIRDPVSTEYIPHFDGSCEPVRPAATMVVAREVELGAQPTRFISTIGLLGLAHSEGVFDNFDPHQVQTVFGYSAYYQHTQSLLLELEPDNQRLQEVIKNDQDKAGVSSRDELIRKLDKDPKKHMRNFPLISPHSITGEDWIMVDAGVRNIGLAPMEIDGQPSADQYDLDQAMGWLRLLIADTERLNAEGITAEVTPRSGFAIAFSKEGLHHQVPPSSNSDNSSIRRRVSVIGLVVDTAAA